MVLLLAWAALADVVAECSPPDLLEGMTVGRAVWHCLLACLLYSTMLEQLAAVAVAVAGVNTQCLTTK
jgi:hypothetical protein